MQYTISTANRTWASQLNDAIRASQNGDTITIESESTIESQYPSDLAEATLQKLQKQVTVERKLITSP